MIVVLVLLLVPGLLLLAYWLGGRGHWARLRPGAEPDAWGALVRRHGLSASEAPRVAHAVLRGQAVAEPHLRPAAADWAERLLDRETVHRPRTRRGRILACVAAAWFAGVVGFLLYRVLTGRPEDVNWVQVAFLACVVAWALRRRRALRRAIALNAGAQES